MKAFVNKLNWRLICIHFVATMFLVIGFKQFSFIYDLESIETLKLHGIEQVQLNGINNMAIAMAISFLLALILSFIISLIICVRLKIFWINSIMVLIIGFLIGGIRDILLVKLISNFLGDLFISWYNLNLS